MKEGKKEGRKKRKGGKKDLLLHLGTAVGLLKKRKGRKEGK